MLQSESAFVTESINVPCTGLFNITVSDYGDWFITLTTNDGREFIASTYVPQKNLFVCVEEDSYETFQLEEWMWEAITSTIHKMYDKLGVTIQ